jgi:MFS family permease
VTFQPWRRSASPLPDSFRTFLFASAASRFGDALIPIALAFAVIDRSESAAVLGAVLIASRAPMAAMLPMAGVLADRYSPAGVMVAADLVRMLAQAVTAWMLLGDNVSIIALCALQVVSGLAGAAFEPAAQAALPRLVATEDLRRANGALTSARNLAGVLAQPAAAAMVLASSSAWPFAIDSLTFLLSAVAVLSLRGTISKQGRAAAGESFTSQLAAGWALIRHRAWLLRLIAFTAAINVGGIAPFLVLGPILADQHGGGPAVWGAAATGFAIGAVLGGLLAMRVEPRQPVRAAVWSAAAICPLFIAFVAGTPAWVLAPLAAIAGAQTSLLNIYSNTTIQRRTPAEYLGRVMSFVFFGSMVLLPLGLGLSGVLADLVTAKTALLISATAVLASVLVTAGTKDLDGAEQSTPEPKSPAAPKPT